MNTKRERRVHRRVGASIVVSARSKDGRRIQTDRIRNISLGGVFIASEEALPFGTTLTLEFTLPTGGSVRCNGTVMWAGPSDDVELRGINGLGVRLSDLSIADMRSVSGCVSDLAGRGSEDPGSED